MGAEADPGKKLCRWQGLFQRLSSSASLEHLEENLGCSIHQLLNTSSYWALEMYLVQESTLRWAVCLQHKLYIEDSCRKKKVEYLFNYFYIDLLLKYFGHLGLSKNSPNIHFFNAEAKTFSSMAWIGDSHLFLTDSSGIDWKYKNLTISLEGCTDKMSHKWFQGWRTV